jgi:hypothetical protein
MKSVLFRVAFALSALALPTSLSAAAPVFDPAPWLEDLTQVRAALARHYANLEWAVFTREADLPALLAATESRIEAASNEADARAAFDRFAVRLGDHHVLFAWPRTRAPNAGATNDPCQNMGYDAASRARPLAADAPGYRALETPQSDAFPAGLIDSGGAEVGVIKIGVFMPQGFPALCKGALATLGLPAGKPCDQTCRDAVDAAVTARLTTDLAAQVRALKSAGAQVLLVDIADNGGGTEWAEVVARMLSPVHLKSERVAFVRGEDWAHQFENDEAALRRFAKATSSEDRAFLLRLADDIEAKRRLAMTPCDLAPLWRGEHPACSWLGDGFYGSGYLQEADRSTLSGKPWAALVFTPMEVAYEEGVWSGPLIVLVNRNTGSAASEFAAVLQDNHAALVFGEIADGGCGHTLDAAPVRLKNSGALFEMPDCARFRADGTNEIMGVEPDVLIGFSATDGPHVRARRFLAKLPDAVLAARAMRKP